jgi:CheY-like chemotaxis protein
VQSVNISKLIEDMKMILRAASPQAITLKFDLLPNVPLIDADAVQLRQILIALFSNAIEAIGHNNGLISISSGKMYCNRQYLAEAYPENQSPDGHYVYLEVADTGCGMDKTTMARLFEPFFSTKLCGKGLGLMAVLNIVRNHKGVIRVTSARKEGSYFRVLIPCHKSQIGSPKTPRFCSRQPEWYAKKTILVVDDEATIRTLARLCLEQFGFSVLLAADGIQAIEIYQQRSSDISAVILDLTMPKMSGTETMRELRKLQPDLRILLSSAYDQADTVAKFTDEQYLDFIPKPYRPQQLLEKIEKLLGD